jgi:glutamate transport system permease protein
MTGTVAVFADKLGPRGKVKVTIATIVGTAALVWLLFVAYRRFEANGQLEGELWSKLFTGDAPQFFWDGLKVTLKLAGLGLALALALGVVLALARLSKRRVVQWVATVWLQFFRGVPLVVLILFFYFGFDQSSFRAVVIGLVLYNSTVLAEIFRAGILSLDRGQSEAALAVGMTDGQAMRMVVFPQAVRRMVPALVSQLVVLLKDTSLGAAIGLEELLRRGQLAGEALKNPLQALLFVAAIYMVVNLLLSALARRIERRQGQGRSKKAAPGGPVRVTGVEDLSVA